MKHRLPSRIICLFTTIVMCGSLIGCGSRPVEQLEVEDKVSKIELSWWGNDPRHIYTMAGVDAFMEENPDIHVDYRYGVWNGYETRTKVYMNSHTESDVCQINFSWLEQYSPNGDGFYDLNQLSDYIDFDNFSEDDLSFGEINGKLNAIPIAYNSALICYNQDLYEAYGLEIPKTWDDLFTAAKVMREDGVYPIGMVKKHAFMMLVAYYEQSTGKNVFAQDGTMKLNKDDVEYLLEFYKMLIDEKVLMPIDQFDRSELANGTMAGALFWISDIDNYAGSIEEVGTPTIGDYLTCKAGDSVTGWYKKPATMYAISAHTAEPEASARLLNYLLNNPDMAVLQGTEKGVPVSASALKAVEDAGMMTGLSHEANEKMKLAGESLSIMIPAMEDENIINRFKDAGDLYIYDKGTLSEAADYFLGNYEPEPSEE